MNQKGELINQNKYGQKTMPDIVYWLNFSSNAHYEGTEMKILLY